MIPLGDSKSDNSGWSDQVGSSPKLGVRAGAIGEAGLGGMVSADWTPVNYNYRSNFGDVSAHRFRILAHVMFEKHVAPKLTIDGRAGAGIDIAHASASATLLGTTFNASDTDVGSAFEFGGGVWFDVGSVQLGGELALPFGGHTHKAQRQQRHHARLHELRPRPVVRRARPAALGPQQPARGGRSDGRAAPRAPRSAAGTSAAPRSRACAAAPRCRACGTRPRRRR